MNQASKEINDAQILQDIDSVRAKFELEGADGHALFIELKVLLKRQGEIHFENEVRDFPHGLKIPWLGEVMDDKGDMMYSWLINQFGKDNFVLMPLNAGGKYEDRWNWVYFRQKDHAMLFKLTWL